MLTNKHVPTTRYVTCRAALQIGSIICQRADQLQAALVVMAKHNKGALQEFFVGSSTTYCTHHCRSPVLVLHCD